TDERPFRNSQIESKVSAEVDVLAPAQPHLKIVQLRMAKHKAKTPAHPRIQEKLASVYKEVWENVGIWPELEREADRVKKDTDLWKALQFVRGKWAQWDITDREYIYIFGMVLLN
ncbi:hypothetical protein MMC12_000429, partial [Toensbergia leucococca]|nr:hypothetical protein [Toensbergia leucococca]